MSSQSASRSDWLRLLVLLVIFPIGAQAVFLSQLGLRLRARAGATLRKGADRLRGLALPFLGAGLLISRLASG